MALEGPRLLSITFDGWIWSDAAASPNATRWTEATIPLAGVTDVAELTLGFDGVQIQHPKPPVAVNVTNTLFLPFAPFSAPADPRETLAFFPGIEYLYETLVITEDPMTEAEAAASFMNLQETIYWRQAYYGSINTIPDVQTSAMSAISMVEGGTMRPTTRDRLYLYQRLEAQGAFDPLAGAARNVNGSVWTYPSSSVLIAARLIRESDLAYIDRTVSSYMRG